MMESGDSRAALPRGTVTLLFADVEGSTRLLHSLGGGYAPVRTRLRELVRSIAREHGGHEVDWAGDGAFLAFSGARGAVAAAAALQRALLDEEWPSEGVLRLRIGIHTGEPVLDAEGYVGMDVVVAARICSAGHGGQIVVSHATRTAAGNEALPGASFRPLGRHRLKDVPEPEQLFQLVLPGLAESLPPLRTLGGATLPTLHHRLVGRRADLAEIQRLLTQPNVRLVTITGPGGAGKSRLALEAAGEAAVERPVHLVGLAPVADAGLVPAAIARTLGVRESPDRSLVQSLADALLGTDSLVLLDNLEHLQGVATHLAELLAAVPDLKLLTTSRVPLQLLAEHVVPLEPLPVDDAAKLFVELAAARGVLLHEDALESVRQICRRLDGLPLAIELVAARLVILPPGQILTALDDGLALEMEGPVDLPERQRTLRATLDWSYGLLNDRQRALHQSLSVFAGGCTLADARRLTDAGPGFLADLEALVAWSLLRSDVTDGDVRLSMLETVREHAETRLQAEGTLADLRRRHAELFLELAVASEDELDGPDQAQWLERLERELDNIRAALGWCLSVGRVEETLRAASSLLRFWRSRGHLTEARRWLSQGLAVADGVPSEVRARALWTAAHEAMIQSDYPAAIPALEEALRLFRELGDYRYCVFALCELARALSSQDQLDAAERAGEEALSIAETAADGRATSAALDTLAMIAGYRGQHDNAQALSKRSLGLRRSLGDPLLIASSANTHGLAAMRAGDLDAAERAFGECLELASSLGDGVHKAAALCALGEIALTRDSLGLAAERLLDAVAVYRELGDERDRAECLHALGGVAAGQGRPLDAARLWGAAETLRGRLAAGLTPEEKAVEQRFLVDVVAVLGEGRFMQARADGESFGPAELETLLNAFGSVARAE